jgi:glutaredoxin 3
MPEPRITLYATPGCPQCAAARAALRSAGASFEELDPSASADVLRELLSFAASAFVPVIVVGGRALVGFDEDRLAEMLREPPTALGEAEDYTDEELNGPDDDPVLLP